MKCLNSRLEREIALCLAMLLVVPSGFAATGALQRSPRAVESPVATESLSQTLDPSAGHRTVTPAEGSLLALSANGSVLPDQQEASQTQQATAPQSAQTTQQNPAPAPAGTAAAPYERPEGVPASRPAGAAIAPGKQRRIRSFSIRIALLVGAGVAIGAVTAASLASPSRAH